MGKKMKNKTDTDTTESNSTLDLKSLIHEHSQFIDKLVELIPAKFYLPTDDEEKTWFQGLSKHAQLSMKKETKKNIKKARRDRLDPESSSLTTHDMLNKRLEEMKAEDDESDESDGDEKAAKPLMSGLESDERSVTYEELQHRLRRKLEQFQAGRNPEGSNRERKRMERKQRYEERKGTEEKKRKREIVSDEKKPADSNVKKIEEDVAEASKALTFSHVKLGSEDESGMKNKKRKLSKAQELERAKQLEEAKSDPTKAENILWKTASSRAAGNKVHDNPKLLKQSIHKEKKKHQKNAEKWKERVETTHKLQRDKQKKRSDNISAKINEKKQRKIAKREKKLMRPGFEGRKQGYVNEGA